MPTDSVAKAKAWRARNVEGGPDGTAGLTTLRGELLKRRIAIADVELGERTRNLLETADAKLAFGSAGVIVRERLLGVGRHLRGHFPQLPEEVFVEIERLHADALRLMADALRRLIEGDDPLIQ